MNFSISGRAGFDLHDCLESICPWLKPQSYLEIGVDGGGSLEAVIQSCPMLGSVTLCDIWSPEYCQHGFASHAHIEKRLADLKFHGTVRYLDGDSAELVPQIKDTFDLILVDGGHDFYHALGDMACALEKLNVNGVMVVDDVYHLSYPDVLKAYRLTLALALLQGFEPLREATGKTSNCAAIRRIR